MCSTIYSVLCFSITITPLGQIICSFTVNFQCYADDIQLYVLVKAGNDAQIRTLDACLCAVKSWMSPNFLLLHPRKFRCWPLALLDMSLVMQQ